MSGDESSGAEERALEIDVGKTEVKKGRVPSEKEESAWKAGDIVWAKVSGFSYWPAKVFDPKDKVIPGWLQDPPKPTYVLVRFFATYDIEWVSPRSIETYEKGLKKKFHIKSRSRVFQKAVQEVKECLATGVVPEGLTAPPPEPQGEEKDGTKDGSQSPRKAAAGSKRKSPSSAKQKSPATKRSRKGSDTGKEGEPEPPSSPKEIKPKEADSNEVTGPGSASQEAVEDTKNQ